MSVLLHIRVKESSRCRRLMVIIIDAEYHPAEAPHWYAFEHGSEVVRGLGFAERQHILTFREEIWCGYPVDDPVCCNGSASMQCRMRLRQAVISSPHLRRRALDNVGGRPCSISCLPSLQAVAPGWMSLLACYFTPVGMPANSSLEECIPLSAGGCFGR